MTINSPQKRLEVFLKYDYTIDVLFYLNVLFEFQAVHLWPEKPEFAPYCLEEELLRSLNPSQLRAFSPSRSTTMASIITSTATCLV